jgi:hypothetical protein
VLQRDFAAARIVELILGDVSFGMQRQRKAALSETPFQPVNGDQFFDADAMLFEAALE